MAEFIDDFLAHVYDPVKAREYYLRTRELKGRKKGSKEDPGGRVEIGKVGTAPKVAPKPTDTKRKQELLARLNRLKEVLDSMQARVDAAKARSGITTPTKKDETEKKSSEPDKAPKKQSAADKRKEAKAAKERYEKNKTAETAKGAQAVQDEIEKVQKQIAEARQELAEALAAARAKAPQPKTAVARRSPQKQEGNRQNEA